MTHRNLLFALIPAIVAGGLTPAQASDFRFTYQGYQLMTAEGRAVLLDRLDRQAKRFCRSGHRMPVYHVRAAKTCQADITSEVVRQIGDRHLTALYDGSDELAANAAE